MMEQGSRESGRVGATAATPPAKIYMETEACTERLVSCQVLGTLPSGTSVDFSQAELATKVKNFLRNRFSRSLEKEKENSATRCSITEALTNISKLSVLRLIDKLLLKDPTADMHEFSSSVGILF